MIPAAGEPAETFWPDGLTRPDVVLTGEPFAASGR